MSTTQASNGHFGRQVNTGSSLTSLDCFAELSVDDAIFAKPPTHEYLRHYRSNRQQVENIYCQWTGQRTFKDALVKNSLICPFISSIINRIRCGKTTAILPTHKEALLSLCDLIQLLKVRSSTPSLKNAVIHFLRFLTVHGSDNQLTKEEYEMIVHIHDIYVRTLDLSEIEPEYLTIICIDLKVLIRNCESGIVQVLNYIIVENEEVLGPKLLDLLFVRDNDFTSLTIINAKLNAAIERYPEFLDPILRIKRYADLSARIEENKLKYFYLGLVRSLIIENVDQMYSNGRVNDWVSHVISALLISAKSSDDITKFAIAKCLGEFGALDFGRFNKTPGSDSSDQPHIFYWDTTQEDFRKALLTRIASKTDSPNEPLNYEVITYTLKEALTALQVKKKDRYLHFLPTNAQALCKSLLETNLNRVIVPVQLEEIESFPIFSPDRRYINWLLLWTRTMVDDLDPSTSPGNLFKSLFSLFVTDIAFLEEMLPCIIFNYLRDPIPSDDRKTQVVVGEITAIINSALPYGQTLATFDISSAVTNQISVTSVILTETQHMCAQRIFVIFDHFTAWLNNLTIAEVAKKLYFTSLFGSTDKCSMAYLAYGCRAYTRSLRYLEEYLRNSDGNLSNICATLFQRIYIALGEPDGVNGVKSIGNYDPDLIDRILVHEANNRFQDALTCCEKSVKSFPENLEPHKKMIRCLMSLEQTATAYNYAAGLTLSAPSWKEKVTPYMATCAWQLGRWKDLDRIIKESEKDVGKSNMSLNLSKLLNCIVTKDSAKFTKLLQEITIKTMHPITAAVSDNSPYERCYPHLIHLQKLNEIRAAATILYKFQPDPFFTDFDSNWLRKLWLERNEYVQPNMKALEPILCLQRALFSLGGQESSTEYAIDIANSWLMSAKLARKSGCLQRAYSCLLEADSMLSLNGVKKTLPFVASFFTEFAKYHWACGDKVSKETAIKCLETALSKYFCNFEESSGISPITSPMKNKVVPQKDQRAHIKILLLRTKFYEESSQLSTPEVIKMYHKLMTEEKRSEKIALQLAKLCEKISGTSETRVLSVLHMVQAICNYKITLTLGSKYVSEALPRLLKLWFWLGTLNYAYETAKTNRGNNANRASETLVSGNTIRDHFNEATLQVERLKKDVPSYILFTAMSQMLSRINHLNKRVQETLQSLVVTVLIRHCHQASWLLLSVQINSECPSLLAACNKIIAEASRGSTEIAEFLKAMQCTAKQFLDLIRVPAKEGRMNLKDCKIGLCAFLRQNRGRILMPCNKFLRATMPSDDVERVHSYNAFSKTVTIASINDEITVFNSLAKPKRITLVAPDNTTYPFLAKPDDDLRRDARVMEYFELMNRLLLKDPETRKRNLQIRVYSVIPFGKNSGLIEFVEGLQDLRSVISNQYTHKNPQFFKNAKSRLPSKNMDDSRALSMFQKYISESCSPPVLWRWFAQTYAHPTVWHTAKLTFTRSLALMSMVGYIIGLGDRHLENILIESATGTIVHVDFNLIFNKGEFLDTPEVVPFRLTHNLVDAMGSTGLEGHFRRTCEEVMRVARSNIDPIMSNLEPFVYDPLVGATIEPKGTQTQKTVRKSRGTSDPVLFRKIDDILSNPKASVRHIVESIEYTDASSIKSIAHIDERLKGLYRKRTSLNTDPRPLSVSGQVNALIEDARDDRNLCRMYIGWAPFL